MKFQTISPIDDSTYVERSYATITDLKNVIAKAQRVKSDWQKTSIAQRAELCLKLVDNILSKKSAIAEEICWQMGRPIQYCEGEVEGFADRAKYMISIAEKKLQSIEIKKQSGFECYIKREPLGIVLTLAPWNYPYLTAVNTIIPALMAGNIVILKPSSQTPLSGERIAQAAQAAGFPDGVFSNLFLSHKLTETFVKNEAIDFVSFTGSVRGGKKINSALIDRFIGAGLELGGKDPAYVCDDADLDYSVASLVDGAFFNSGQSCCAVERIYVHEALYDRFVKGFVETVNQYTLGKPNNDSVTLGPMVSVAAADVVRKQMNQAISKGAKALIDEHKFSAACHSLSYLSPQVFVDVNHSMRIMTEETFGPVVGIMKISDDDEAISYMNDSQYGLTASVWTKDKARAIAIGDRIHTGTWFMNRCDYLDPALAWVGVKNSGNGCTLSELGYEQLTRPKSYHLKLSTS